MTAAERKPASHLAWATALLLGAFIMTDGFVRSADAGRSVTAWRYAFWGMMNAYSFASRMASYRETLARGDAPVE
jgi:heme A synthase